MTENTFTTTQDTFSNQDQGATNFGKEVYLRLQEDSGSYRRAYVYFGLPGTLAGSTVVSATLKFTLRAAWSGSNTLTAKRITATWSELGLTYNNAPDVSTTHSGAATVTTGAVGDEVEVDVTTMLQDVADGEAWYGVRLEVAGTAIRELFSSETANAGKRPQLTIEWSVPGDVPSNLRPDSGRAVGLEEPLLAWASNTPSEVNLQIDTVETFDSDTGDIPEWDSGWVAWTTKSYDTFNDDSPPLLVDETTYFWRVRIKDGAGVETGWSEPAEFQYVSNGTLTITFPATDNDDVTETTPPVTHTFADRTQTYTQHLLYENGTLVFNTGKVVNTTTSYTVPDSYIRSTSADYTLTLRVWDDQNREGLGDDLPYVEASRIFQYAWAAVTEATGFSATTDGGHVQLAWSRASAPDYFCLLVDGAVVEDLIDPDEAFDSGTSYSWSYYGATPLASATYKLQSVVSNAGILKHSNNAPSSVLTYSPIGIYLVDPSDETELLILGQAVDTVIGESGATFFPLGRRDPVRVTDTIRGLEGTVTGDIASQANWNIAGLKAAFEDLKARTSGLRLVYGHRNIPVIVGEAEFSLWPSETEVYSVSFPFWQTGEFDIDWEE